MALIVVLGVAGLAACGSQNQSGSADATALLKDTFGPGHPIKLGRLDLQVHLSGTGAGLGQPVNLAVGGPFMALNPATLPQFAFKLDLGEPTSASIISTGKQGFLVLNGQAFVFSPSTYSALKASYAKTQRQSDSERQKTPTLSALGVEPARWLKNAREDGTSSVGGTPTIQVTGDVDTSALLDDVDRLLKRSGSLPAAAGGANVPKQLGPAQKQALARSVTRAAVTVDTGKSDHTLRRVTIRLILAVKPADRAALGGLQKLDLDVELAISQLGHPQQILAPKSSRPISDLKSVLGSFSTGTGTTTTPAPTTTGSQQQYDECLSKAGSDVTAIQGCASLLNGG